MLRKCLTTLLEEDSPKLWQFLTMLYNLLHVNIWKIKKIMSSFKLFKFLNERVSANGPSSIKKKIVKKLNLIDIRLIWKLNNLDRIIRFIWVDRQNVNETINKKIKMKMERMHVLRGI